MPPASPALKGSSQLHTLGFAGGSVVESKSRVAAQPAVNLTWIDDQRFAQGSDFKAVVMPKANHIVLFASGNGTPDVVKMIDGESLSRQVHLGVFTVALELRKLRRRGDNADPVAVVVAED